MATYRIYRVATGGRLQLGESFEAADDAEAVRLAGDLRGGQAVELWEGGRLVGRISKLGVFTPGPH